MPGRKDIVMGGGGSAPKTVQYEPVKPAEEAMKEASMDTARAQQLRRGIASTFSRSSMASASGSSATAGTSSKLGG